MNKVFIFATYGLTDPPIQNTIISLSKSEWEVTVIDFNKYKQSIYFNVKLNKLKIHYSILKLFPSFIKSFLIWIILLSKSYYYILSKKPNLIIAEMLTPLIVIPSGYLKNTICFIPDIQNIKFSGYLDRIAIRYGIKKLKTCKLVWASDKFKAELIQIQANLKKQPLICHNCPPLNYFENLNKAESRNWLNDILINKNISITKESVLLLRAGAIGPYGGIEETISALKSIAKNVIFIMMGRPSQNYYEKLIKIIAENNLANRVYIFNKPSNSEWKKILLASDIGHLIHIRPDEKEDESIAINYDLNSSLSNNRLFQYMAAGLPIISYNDPRMNSIYNEVDCFSIINTLNYIDEFKRVCIDFQKDNKKLLNMGMNARKAYVEKYHWENQFKIINEKINNEC
jgi:glycosyltransferase involved in cell wall biosynthesis